MKLFSIHCTVALSALILTASSRAGDNDSKKEVVPMEQPAARSRWSLSGGAAVSSIKSTFTPDPGLSATFQDGSISIFDGTATQVYANGTVGPLSLGDRFGLVQKFTGGLFSDFRTLDTYFGSAATMPGSTSDTETSLGAYIRLNYDWKDFESDTLHLGFFGQYTFTTSFHTGISPFSVNSVATTYTVVEGPSLAYNDSGGFNAPTQTSSTQVFSVNSGLNIYMHTFELGLSLSKDLGDRLHLTLFTGPTLNLFETGLTSSLSGPPGSTTLAFARNDKSTVCFGWDVQAGLQYDLGARKKWFLEALGGYHYVDSFTVSDTISSAKIQASSWSAELGLGLRF
jgi:hypothetical protein